MICAIEIPTRLPSWNFGGRLVGLFQFLTGIWLMYCTYAITAGPGTPGAKAWVRENQSEVLQREHEN